MQKVYDTAIVGGGIAAFTAALTAKNLLLDYVWLGERSDKLRLAEKVTNFPAVTGTGADFAAALQAQMEAEGLVLTERRIDGVFRTGGFYTLTAGAENFLSKTVILATGVESKGVCAGEKEFLGRGVSYCAVCDGALYRGKKIAAVISSPKFEEEAEYLAKFADTVYCVCLYPVSCLAGENIVVLHKTPTAVSGGSHVDALLFGEERLEVSGVFFLKNSAPADALVYGIGMDGPHVRVGRDLSTDLAGVFAAGDVTGRPYQYAKAAGEGCVAAHSARAFVRSMEKN